LPAPLQKFREPASTIDPADKKVCFDAVDATKAHTVTEEELILKMSEVGYVFRDEVVAFPKTASWMYCTRSTRGGSARGGKAEMAVRQSMCGWQKTS
jgi:hypothetical protein